MTRIHAFRDQEGGPDRTVYLCGTAACDNDAPATAADCPGGKVIGWIERGRPMVTIQNGFTRTWDEWAFTAIDTAIPVVVRQSYSAARNDAHLFAQVITV